ncbi:MAG: hypothetical protein KIT79_12585 [Deltaproteobacteria bacterium]|nr:hypothetical protein [Deltaproteobacteria bacterium]
MSTGPLIAAGKLLETVRRLVEKAMPDLSHYMRFPVEGVVTKLHQGPSAYGVDVQLMDRRGRLTDQVITGLELDPLVGRDGAGIFALPAVGTAVRVAFLYGDPNRPYLDGRTTHSRMKRLAQPGAAAGEIVFVNGAARVVLRQGIAEIMAPLIQLMGRVQLVAPVGGPAGMELAPGHAIDLKPGGITEILATLLTVTSPQTAINGLVDLGGPAGRPVARHGDLVDVSGLRDSMGGAVTVLGQPPSVIATAVKTRAE